MDHVTENLPTLRARVRQAIKKRLAPGAVEKEVDRHADSFVRASVEKILGVAFGFDTRWAGEYSFHNAFEKGALAKRLDQLVQSPEIDAFLVEAIGNFRALMKPKVLREWAALYRARFNEAYWERAEEMLRLDATHFGRERAESDYDKMLRAIVDKEIGKKADEDDA